MPPLNPVIRRQTPEHRLARLQRQLERQFVQIQTLQRDLALQATTGGDTLRHVTQGLNTKAPDDAAYILSQLRTGLGSGRVLADTATVTWSFATAGQARATSLSGGSQALNPPPEIETASATGIVTGRYALEDHTHSGVNLGDAQTITGAKTFDRDPSAPFLVTASSALVANLDSDKWDGQQYATDTFTITGTGFVDPDPTGTARWVTVGQGVLLFLPTITGTSDAVTFTLTGLPAAVTPTQNSRHPVLVVDLGVSALGSLQLNAASTTIVLAPSADTTATSTWTATGTKTLRATWLAYALL